MSTGSEKDGSWGATGSKRGLGLEAKGSGSGDGSVMVELVLDQDYEAVLGESEMRASSLRVSISRFDLAF